jgi:hypothetical protein
MMIKDIVGIILIVCILVGIFGIVGYASCQSSRSTRECATMCHPYQYRVIAGDCYCADSQKASWNLIDDEHGS